MVGPRGLMPVKCLGAGLVAQTPGAKPDQSGAQQRRGMSVVIARWQGETEALVRRGIFVKAPITVVALDMGWSQSFSRSMAQNEQ